MKEIFEKSKTFLMTGTDLVYTFKGLKRYNSIQIILTWANLTHTDGTVAYAQGVSDTFNTIVALAVNLNSASGTASMEDTSFGAEDVKLTVAKGSNTAGTVTAHLIAKMV
jgi:hypothetical protein